MKVFDSVAADPFMHPEALRRFRVVETRRKWRQRSPFLGEMGRFVNPRATLTPDEVGPSEWTGLGACFDHQPDTLILELLRGQVAQRRVEPTPVVDVVDEAGKVVRHIGEGLVGHGIDGLDLQRLHEAFGLGIVVGVAAPSHRADQAMRIEDFAIGFCGVLRSAIGVVDAAGRRFPGLDRGLQCRNGQTGIDRSADGIANDPPRPSVEDDGDIGEAGQDRDVGDVGDPELVGTVDGHILSTVGKDGPVVIAVGRGK